MWGGDAQLMFGFVLCMDFYIDMFKVFVDIEA